MAFQTDAFYHLSVLFILSIMIFPLKRSSLVALVLAIPALTEIVQFFMPGRVPDFMDAFHGYLGIILAYCLVQMWREIAPVARKFRQIENCDIRELEIRELGNSKISQSRSVIHRLPFTVYCAKRPEPAWPELVEGVEGLTVYRSLFLSCR